MRSSRSRRRSHEDGDHEDSGEDQAHEVPADASDQSRHDEHFHGWLGPLQAASALAAHLAGCPLARTRGVEYQTFARRLLVSGPPNEQTLRIMTANRGHSVVRSSSNLGRTPHVGFNSEEEPEPLWWNSFRKSSGIFSMPQGLCVPSGEDVARFGFNRVQRGISSYRSFARMKKITFKGAYDAGGTRFYRAGGSQTTRGHSDF